MRRRDVMRQHPAFRAVGFFAHKHALPYFGGCRFLGRLSCSAHWGESIDRSRRGARAPPLRLGETAIRAKMPGDRCVFGVATMSRANGSPFLNRRRGAEAVVLRLHRLPVVPKQHPPVRKISSMSYFPFPMIPGIASAASILFLARIALNGRVFAFLYTGISNASFISGHCCACVRSTDEASCGWGATAIYAAVARSGAHRSLVCGPDARI